MTDIKIRSYQAGDETGISKLLNENSPYLRDLHFWTWINRILPTSDSIVIVAEVEDLIVGHYAIIPKELIDGDQKLKVGLGIHAFVHPDYRDKVSIFSISSYAYKEAEKLGFDFLVGFPNKNYRLIQEKIERWKRIKIFNAIESKVDRSVQGTILEWEEVKTDMNQLFAEIQRFISTSELHTDLVHFNHDVNFWIKRYFLHPQDPYKFYLVRKSNKVEAVVVLKEYELDTERHLHLIDSVFSRKIGYKELISDLQHISLASETDKIVLWPENERRKSILLQLGFTETGFDTFFGLKEINKNLSYARYLNFQNWKLSMGDSDAF